MKVYAALGHTLCLAFEVCLSLCRSLSLSLSLSLSQSDAICLRFGMDTLVSGLSGSDNVPHTPQRMPPSHADEADDMLSLTCEPGEPGMCWGDSSVDPATRMQPLPSPLTGETPSDATVHTTTPDL